METIVGIFSQRQEAENAVKQLCALGLTHKHVNILTPEASDQEINAVPTTQTEQPGMGKALGSVIGGGTGLFVGGATGSTAASLFVPGIGFIIAVGLAAAAFSGIVGAAVGAAAGGTLEHSLDTGLPQDEIFVYEEALRQGRTVIIVLTEEEAQEETVRNVLIHAGAESLDAAREQWWIGLRDAEEAAYDTPDGEFSRIESTYRTGFEAALRPPVRGRSYEEARDYLHEHYPTLCLEEPFRRGYERGQAHHQALVERPTHSDEDKTGPSNTNAHYSRG
jgi:hypothetical protein